MIDPRTLLLKDVGRNMTYTDSSGKREYGTLSSWNDKYVFVRFKGPNGEACSPEDVSFDEFAEREREA